MRFRLKYPAILVAFVLLAAGGYVASTFGAAGDPVVGCATATATASVTPKTISIYTTPISTVPGATVVRTNSVCVTVTAETQTVTVTTTTPGTTTEPPPPPPPPPPGCTTTISSGLAAAISGAAGGDTICLNTGSYGNLNLTNVRKSSDVTIQPVSGASAIVGSVTLQNTSHLHFTGGNGSLTVGSSTLDSINTLPNCSDHITFDYLRFLGLGIFPRCSAMAILVDHANMDNLLNAAGGEGRINVQALDQGPNADQGITISNNSMNGGCSKGVQVLGGAYGVKIINNEFAFEPNQSTCDAINGIHIGGIQLYGASHSIVKGNYFHDNGTSAGGLNMGDGDYTTVEDNAWVCTCIYPWSVQAYATVGSTFRHNTFAGGGGLHFQYQSGYPSGNHIFDNVFTNPDNAITDSSGANWGTEDHNLNSGLNGVGDITGTPLFVGGGSTSNYTNWYLLPGSPGENAASDGLDMGIR